MFKKCAMVAALLILLAPASAKADWLFTPNIGPDFGGSTGGAEHLTYGFSLGYMGAGTFGWELDFAFSPEFFQSEDDDVDLFDDDNVTTFMFNAVAGIPIGGQRGGGFRPYVSGGGGLMQTHINDVDRLFEVNNNEFGVNVGAGAHGFMTDHVGLRGDLRYYRQLTDPEPDNEFDVDFDDLDFWRATLGVTFRW